MNRSERYCYSRARWEDFKIRTGEEVGGVNGNNIDSWNRSICNMLKKVADECIPKSSGPKEHQLVPWWNDACYQAIRARNKANRRLRKSPTENNAIE